MKLSLPRFSSTATRSVRRAWPVLVAVIGFAALIWIGAAGLGRRADLDPSLRQWLTGRGTLSLAVSTDRPPYGFFNGSDRYVGYDADLASGLAMVLGTELQLLPLDENQALRLLREGQLDAVVGQTAIDPSSGRARSELAFTRPYLVSALSLFLPSQQVGVIGLEELRGQLVAAVRGSLAESVLAQRGISSFPVGSIEEGLGVAARGQAVAFLGEENETLRVLRDLDLDLKLAGDPVVRLSYSIAARAGEDRTLAAFDAGLNALEEMGLLSQLERRWFGIRPGSPSASPSPDLTVWLALAVLLLAAATGALAWTRSLRREVAGQQRELFDVRDKYRKLLESANDSILTVNPSDGSILEVNRRVEDLTGYGKKELLTMDLSRLLSLKDRRRALEGLQAVLLSGSGRVEDMNLVRRDGASLAVDLNAHVVAYANRRVIQCIIRDVTERKEMRREILERNQDLATINSIATLVSRFVDLEEVLKQVLDQVLGLMKMDAGVIYLREDSAQSSPGAPSGGLRPVVQRPNPDGESGPDGLSLAAQAVARGEPLLISDSAGDPQLEGMRARRGRFASVAAVPLKAKQEILGVMNLYGQTLQHFTPEDRELLESIGNQIGMAVESARLFQRLNRTVRELSAVRQFNESVLESMSDGLLVVDAHGRVSLANRGAEVILGYPAGEVETKNIEQVLGSGERYVRECLSQGVTILRREVDVEKGGRRIPLGLSISPLRGDSDVVSGVVVVFRDLSEARAMEEEKRRLDRLALLGEMSAVVAHEIRNPLAGIGAGLQHMVSQLRPGDAFYEDAQRVLQESRHLDRIIEDILMISRPVRLRLAPCDVAQVVEAVLGRVEERARTAGVAVQRELDPNLPRIRGDAMRLEQALSNLVVNSLEAMPSGGQLSVRVKHSKGSDRIHIEVMDSGVGMKPEEARGIFEPFYTTKTGGTGLGLAIVKRIVEEHGGQIEVESQAGSGTRFQVVLPVQGR